MQKLTSRMARGAELVPLVEVAYVSGFTCALVHLLGPCLTDEQRAVVRVTTCQHLTVPLDNLWVADDAARVLDQAYMTICRRWVYTRALDV